MPYLFSRGSSFCFSGSETPHSFCITMKIPFLFLAAAVVSVSSVADSVFEIQDETEDALSLLQVTANKHDLNDDRPRNNLCKTGIRKNRFCCGSQCRTCGGRGCQNRPGGQSSCCLASIKASGRKCNGRNMQNCMMPRRNRRRGRGRGQNQGNAGEERILFGGVLPGKDLLVSSTSSYTPNMLNPSGRVLRNGARQGFGVINMASGSSVDLSFILRDSITGAHSPDSFVVSFFDGDHGMSHESREIVTISKMSNFIVDDNTELEITETATDDASLAGGVGFATFTSTLRGTKEDNPLSPLALSDLQKQRSVEVYFENRAKFDVTLAATGYVNPQGRNMMFAGASTLTCPQEAKCSSYECPLGFRMRQDAEFTVCASKPCTAADNDACCFEEVVAIVPPAARNRRR